MAHLLRETRIEHSDRVLVFSVWTDIADITDPRRVRLTQAINDFSIDSFQNFGIMCKNYVGNSHAFLPDTNRNGGNIGAVVFADNGLFSVTQDLSNPNFDDVFLHVTYSRI